MAAVDELRDVEEALGAQEVSSSRFDIAEHRRQQRRLVLVNDVARDRGQIS